MTVESGIQSSHFDNHHRMKQENYGQAAVLPSQRLAEDPPDRQNHLLVLLRNVRTYGPEKFEDQIDDLRSLYDLNSAEKDIVREIFLLGYQTAEANGNTEQRWAYQRLLRKLLLGQPLTQEIPRTDERRAVDARSNFIELLAEHRVAPCLETGYQPAQPRAVAQTAPMRRKFKQALLSITACGLLAAPAFFIAAEIIPVPGESPETSLSTNPLTEQSALASYTSRLMNDAGAIESRSAKLLDDQLLNLRRLYGRWLVKNRDLMGTLSIRVKLDETGQVVQAEEIASRFTDPAFLAAVMREARNWKFQAGAESAQITIPLLFVPKGLDGATIARWEESLQAASLR
jgi:hypothetical protein